MDILLHPGAHRTGTTTFQHYLRAQRGALTTRDVGFWGPWRMRKGMLAGVLDDTGPQAFAAGTERVQLNLRGTRARGISALVVSEENMLGTIRQNAATGRVYPDAGARLARLALALGEGFRLHLQIRALDSWWASVLAYAVARGDPVPGSLMRNRIAFAPRSWRHVICDLAQACPRAPITVSLYEDYVSQPDALLSRMLDRPMPRAVREPCLNQSAPLTQLRLALHRRGADPLQVPAGVGRWQPFDAVQISALQEAYADDLYWLRSGADGRATLLAPQTRAKRMTMRG